MARITTLQEFASVSALKEYYKTTLPRPHDWRLIALPVVGAIHGIPTSQGTAIATNGILVAIVQPSGLFIGHMDNFVPDEQQPETTVKVVKVKMTKERKQTVDISEFY